VLIICAAMKAPSAPWLRDLVRVSSSGSRVYRS